MDMPRFPIDEIGNMTKEEKFNSVAIYIAKTVDHLKGVHDERKSLPLRRPNHDSSTGSDVSSNLKGEDLLHDLGTGVSSLEVREEPASEKIGISEVASG